MTRGLFSLGGCRGESSEEPEVGDERRWSRGLTAHPFTRRAERTVQYSTTNSNLYGSNTNQTIYASTSDMPTWVWKHIVYTLDGYKQTTYFDGEKSYSSDSSLFMPKLVRTKHYIGKSIRDESPGTGDGTPHFLNFNGKIGYIRVWQDVALGESDVNILYTNREQKLTTSLLNSINHISFGNQLSVSNHAPDSSQTELTFNSNSPGWTNTTKAFNTYRIYFWPDLNNHSWPTDYHYASAYIRVERWKLYGYEQTNSPISDFKQSTKDRWRNESGTQRLFIDLPRPTWPSSMQIAYRSNTEYIDVNFTGNDQKSFRKNDLPGGSSRLTVEPLGIHSIWVNGTNYTKERTPNGKLIRSYLP